MTAAWLLRSPPNWKVSETNQGVSLWRFHQRLTQLYRRSCRCMEHCRAAITSLLTDDCIASIYVTILTGCVGCVAAFSAKLFLVRVPMSSRVVGLQARYARRLSDLITKS